MTTQFHLTILPEIDSTSAEIARRLAAGTALDGLALLALRQTAGRGRLGRPWKAPEGNLNLSLLIRTTTVPAGGHWSLMAAVALLEALRSQVPDPAALRLKWPNDVLLHGRKCAGILLEVLATPDTGSALVFGVGINLRAVPDGLDRAVACLGELCPPPGPEAVAQEFLAALGRWTGVLTTAGFTPIREAWLAGGHVLGDLLTIDQGGTRRQGHFAGLAASGALLLASDDIVSEIHAGDISYA